MTDKIAKGESFGAILQDGSYKAAERIGKGSEQYAMHIGGQDLPAHDPKLGYHFATTYRMDATPGRHTQGNEGDVAPGLIQGFYEKAFTGRGEAHRRSSAVTHVINAVGMCLAGYVCLPDVIAVPEFLSAITGWDIGLEEVIKAGDRIANLRHAFNLREGINPLKLKVPDRVLGKPAQTAGPVAGITVDEDNLVKEYMAVMDWEPGTAKPSKEILLKLGLDDVAKDLWGTGHRVDLPT